ncbi:hypothetical protein LQF12_13725 [Ruania suaedae]|uniref:hypothetical protein n=1 Tax=Ruania suaedae TaxID=2897774 RepID=UPI001E46D2B0|nr:hypothetical protein [Ruania suaedae]UFU02538.1 hypothetical protein LQF12_13725 [Ruania suaedae]
MKEPVEEFTLEIGEGLNVSPGSARAAGAAPRRRRSSPWPWVAAALALAVSGVAISPGGERPDPRPPQTAWTHPSTPGRAPGAWTLEGAPVVASSTGVAAFEPTTGAELWSVPLDDPACTAAAEQLTCVHGQGEGAMMATISASGTLHEEPLPGADIAMAYDGDLLVGGLEPERPWLGRFTAEQPRREIWRVRAERPSDAMRWQGMTLSQGVATVHSGRDADGWARFGMAAEVETGEMTTAIVLAPGGSSGFGAGPPLGADPDMLLPLAGPGLDVPGRPEAVVNRRGVFTEADGDPLLEVNGFSLAAYGDDIVAFTADPGAPPEHREVRIERLDVRTGESLWAIPLDLVATCPCARSADTLVLTDLVEREDPPEFTSPVRVRALLGVDPEAGLLRWRLPVTGPPDAFTADVGRLYVLAEGTLTAYATR